MNVEKDYFWFWLFKARGIGPKSLILIAQILEKKDPQPEMLPRSQSGLSAQFPELSKILKNIREADNEKVYAEYEELKTRGMEIIYPKHPNTPPSLFEIAPILFIKGKRELLTSNGVAIVGSRNVSDTGIHISRKLAAELANEGLNVVSGYAKGVDSAAHLGALAAKGTTTIVLPYGIKELRQKREFREFNWERDVLAVSQFNPADKWLARNAMTRNKLVCALSKAVIVIESEQESGTFNTAQTALEMKRPLFVLDPKCPGIRPQGNEILINLGGERFNPDNGVAEIAKRISAIKMEKFPDEKKVSSEQLEFSY